MPDRPIFSRWDRLKYWLVSQLAARLLRTIFRTCRYEIMREDLVKKYFEAGQGGIGITWHRGAIFALYYFGKVKPAIMISRSRDGEYMARYLKIMGGIPVRGSSSRGGLSALKEMADYLGAEPGRYAATVADGPQGPRYQARAGMISLAMKTGLPLIPLMWSAKRVWVLKNTWDRTMIPKPFAKIVLNAGPEFRYPPNLTPAQRGEALLELEQAMNKLKDELDLITGYQDPA